MCDLDRASASVESLGWALMLDKGIRTAQRNANCQLDKGFRTARSNSQNYVCLTLLLESALSIKPSDILMITKLAIGSRTWRRNGEVAFLRMWTPIIDRYVILNIFLQSIEHTSVISTHDYLGPNNNT
jgi:hypothetical protein